MNIVMGDNIVRIIYNEMMVETERENMITTDKEGENGRWLKIQVS